MTKATTRMNRRMKPFNFNAVGERQRLPRRGSNPNLVASLASDSSWLHSSGIVSTLVQWPSGRIAQGTWGGRLFHSLTCARPTTWAKSIQMTAPHSLGYSTSLACPIMFVFLSLSSWLKGVKKEPETINWLVLTFLEWEGKTRFIAVLVE